MSIPYVVDGETELSSELFNPWVDQMNGLQTGALPIALAGIEGALGEYEPLGNALSLQIDPRMYVDDWSGAADKAPHIQDALNDAAAALSGVSGESGGAQVVLPKDNCVIRSQLVVPSFVWLVGRAETGSRLTAHADFPENTAMVRMGAGVALFDTGMGLRDLTISCEDLPGVGGVYSNSWQEPAGLERLRIRAYRGRALHCADTGSGRRSSHAYIRRCEFYASYLGLDVPESIFIDGGGNTHVFEGCTVTANSAHHAGANTAAIRVTHADVLVLASHFEQHADGVSIARGAGRGGGVVVTSTGHESVTNVVHIASDDPPVSLLGIRALGATRAFLNDYSGESATLSIGLYSNRRGTVRGRTRALRQVSTDFTINDTHDVMEVDCSGGTRTIALPDPTTNKGQEFVVKHAGSANNVVLDPAGSATIDGALTKTITTVGGYLTVYSNGTEYKIIGSGGTIT